MNYKAKRKERKSEVQVRTEGVCFLKFPYVLCWRVGRVSFLFLLGLRVCLSAHGKRRTRARGGKEEGERDSERGRLVKQRPLYIVTWSNIS